MSTRKAPRQAERLKQKPPTKKRKLRRRRGLSRRGVIEVQHELNLLWIRRETLEANMTDEALKLELNRNKRTRLYVV